MIITLKNIILIILTIFTFISILLFINHELIIINNNNINNKGNYDIDHHGNIIFRIVEEGFKLAPRGKNIDTHQGIYLLICHVYSRFIQDLSIHPIIHLSIYPIIYPFIYPFIYLYIILLSIYIHLSIYL